MEYRTTGKHCISVYYDSWMDGGGMWFGLDYIEVIQQRYPDRQFGHCLEWCSGPGFIGFELLDHGVCERLCLTDIYTPAIDRTQQTIQKLPDVYQHRVSAYAAPSVSGLPVTKQFDLVVANPPHFLECPGDDNIQRIKVDSNWAAHRDFFFNIKQHLTPDGVILLQENQAGSLHREKDFAQDIESAGLQITAVFDSARYYTPNDHTQIYYIEIAHK
jgi:methylase of polypeptide subunit release factors